MSFKYFKKEEFKCSCCSENKINDQLLRKLDEAREIAQTPFKINSGYRCKKHNAKIGGEPESAHTLGLACDISAQTSAQKYKILSALLKVGFERIGVYKTFIHCDIDEQKPSKIVWVG